MDDGHLLASSRLSNGGRMTQSQLVSACNTIATTHRRATNSCQEDTPELQNELEEAIDLAETIIEAGMKTQAKALLLERGLSVRSIREWLEE